MKSDLHTSEVLARLPMFAGMDDAERGQLLEIAGVATFERGDYILKQGEESQQLFVVLEGRCQVLKGNGTPRASEKLLARLGPHEHFGEMSFFHAAPHSASVRAEEAMRLLEIDREPYGRLIDAGSLAAYKLAFNILDELADRLRRMDDWVSMLLQEEEAAGPVSEWSHFRDKLFNGWRP